MSAPSPRNPTGRASRTPTPSITHHHVPATPSGLRQSHTVATSPEDTRDATNSAGIDEAEAAALSSTEPSPNTYPTNMDNEPEEEQELDADADGTAQEESSLLTKGVNETTSLLRKPFEFVMGKPHAGPCNHGTFSPQLDSSAGSIRSTNAFGGRPGSVEERPGSAEGSRSLIGSLLENVGVKNGSGGKKKMSTTRYLAERHGIKNTTSMYVTLISSRYGIC